MGTQEERFYYIKHFCKWTKTQNRFRLYNIDINTGQKKQNRFRLYNIDINIDIGTQQIRFFAIKICFISGIRTYTHTYIHTKAEGLN